MGNRIFAAVLCLLCVGACLAQTNPPAYTVQTLAGSASTGDGGAADTAILRFPSALAFDANNNLYIADQGNSSIRLVTPSGVISTIVGTGISGFSGDGGPANLAQLSGVINGLAVDTAGNLYISDSGNRRIRVVTKADGNINTVVCGSNLSGLATGQFAPNALALDAKGNLYIADGNNSDVYIMAPNGGLALFAGSGKAGDGGDEGLATAATLNTPFGLFADATGTVYITDMAAGRVRKVTPDGTIHAVGSSIAQPMHVAADKNGNLYITDHSLTNPNIQLIDVTGNQTTFIGGPNPNGLMSGDGGPAALAMIQQATGIAISPAGDLYFSDSNSSVRAVSGGMISTIVGHRHFLGDTLPAAQSLLANPGSLALDIVGNVYIADTNNFRLREVDTTGTMWTVAGTGQCGSTDDGGLAAFASMTKPLVVATDSAQNIYLGFNGALRRISAGGIITTIAGRGTLLDDGIPATNARLGKVQGIVVDASGVIYFSDTDHNLIRKITPDGIITTVAGTGEVGDSGDGLPAFKAVLNGPTNLALDSAGNLYFADTGNNRVRKIKADGTMATFAGNGQMGESGDAAAAVAAMLSTPVGLAVDKSGTVYIGDVGSGMIRAVTPDGLIHTIAGSSNRGFAGDGAAALTAQFNGPASLAIDAAGHVYVLDQNNERVRMLTPMAPPPPPSTFF